MPFKDWSIIVGMTALKDCLGPNVLKGLNIIVFKPNDLLKESTNWSAATLVAA